MSDVYISTDNVVTWSELKDAETDAYDNAATLTMSLFKKVPLNPIAAGPAVLKGGGLVGIPCTAHGLIENDYIRIEGSQNYNDEFTVHADTTANEIVITHTQDAETFLGTERIFIGIADGTNVPLPYTGTPGLYRGTLPDTLQRMIEYTASQTYGELSETGKYYLFVEAVNGASRTTKRVPLEAIYDS
jgi:hypothetical protein